MKNSIKERSKTVPLRTKIEVFFSMEYDKLTKSKNLLSKESLGYGKKKTSELIKILNQASGEIQSVIDNEAKKRVCTTPSEQPYKCETVKGCKFCNSYK